MYIYIFIDVYIYIYIVSWNAAYRYVVCVWSLFKSFSTGLEARECDAESSRTKVLGGLSYWMLEYTLVEEIPLNTRLQLTSKNCNLEKVWAEKFHGLFSTSSGFSGYVQVPHIFEETWQPVGMLKRWNRSNPWGLEAETTTTGHPPNDFCATFLWADIRWIEIPPMFFFSEYLNSLYFFIRRYGDFMGTIFQG